MVSNRARDLRSNPTDAETRLWFALRRRQLDGYRFRRQVPLGPYVADFACLSHRLVVEVDGGQHGNDKDSDRDAWLNRRGYRVIRIWNNEVFENLEGVLQVILQALHDNQPPLPTPPPPGGREQK